MRSHLQRWKADWWFLGSGGRAGRGGGGDYNEHEETCPGSRCIHYLDCGSGFTGGYSPPTLSKLHTQNVQFIVSQLYRKKALFPSLLTPLHFFKGSGEDLNYFQLHFSCQVSPHAETGRAEARLCLAYIHYVYSSGRLNIQQWLGLIMLHSRYHPTGTELSI